MNPQFMYAIARIERAVLAWYVEVYREDGKAVAKWRTSGADLVRDVQRAAENDRVEMLFSDQFPSVPGVRFWGRRIAIAADGVIQAVGYPCPDCHGTGEYLGLAEIDVCRTCNGTKVTTGGSA